MVYVRTFFLNAWVSQKVCVFVKTPWEVSLDMLFKCKMQHSLHYNADCLVISRSCDFTVIVDTIVLIWFIHFLFLGSICDCMIFCLLVDCTVVAG